jgi:hypothetical protein
MVGKSPDNLEKMVIDANPTPAMRINRMPLFFDVIK